MESGMLKLGRKILCPFLVISLCFLLQACLSSSNNVSDAKAEISKEKNLDDKQEVKKVEPVKTKKAAKPVKVNQTKKAKQQDEGMTVEQLAKAAELIEKYSDTNLDGKKLYKSYCGLCHGTKGNLNLNDAKDLTKSTIGLEEAVAQVYYGKGMMTPFKEVLEEEQIVAVTKFVEVFRK